MADEQEVQSALRMDRDDAIGNSDDVFGRRALHVKVANKASEPFPVYEVSAPSGEALNEYDEEIDVASGAEVTVTEYTVPAAKTLDLLQVEFSGSNIGTYRVRLNGDVIATRRTNFGADLSGAFVFEVGDELGLLLVAGDQVEMTAEHGRPYVGDFEARIVGVLKNV